MSTSEKVLDADELLHLAIDASKQDNNEDAIRLLKQALENNPEDAKLHYMLGAMYAEIGMYDRAAVEMAEAVKIDPKLYTAHFQLGLLFITAGNIAEAEQAWAPLDELGEESPLYLFKSGMLQLVQDNFEECITLLAKGMELNDSNDPLNNDMRRILNQAKDALQANKDLPDKPEESKADEDSSHVFLNAYKDDDFGNKH